MHLLNMYSEDGSILGKEGWGVFFFYYKCFLLIIRIKSFETECKMIVFAFSYDNTPSEDLEIIVF